MVLHDKTRLIVTHHRDLFLHAVALIHDQLMEATLYYPPNPPEGHEEKFKQKAAQDTASVCAWLATMTNVADPSLAVDPTKIIRPHVWLQADYANLLFEFMSDEGMQAVSVRLAPELYHRHG